MASFKEASRQLQSDAASRSSASSTGSYQTAPSIVSSRAKPGTRRHVTTASRSASVASSSTATSSTCSIPTPHADEFPAAPHADKLHVQRDLIVLLQHAAAQHGVSLDVERVYRQQLRIALDIEAASARAFAMTLHAVGTALEDKTSRHDAARRGKQ